MLKYMLYNVSFNLASPTKERPERPPIGTKTVITTSTTLKSPLSTATTQSHSYRKDSFGSKDSLTDTTSSLITSERSNSGLFGNVAAHRRSLESKSLEITSIEKPPRKSIITDANKTPSDIRKSLENLDEKKTTPPPVLSKKPSVPIKKSPSVSTVAGSIFSGLKQKVKSVENKLHHTHDGTDGSASSRLTGTAHIADNSDKGVTGERINDLDHVERGSYLQDVRQNRAKAPKRRPPTSAGSIMGDSNNNSVSSMNGSHNMDNSSDSLVNEPSSPTPIITHNDGDELAKPKAREWEKHRAPWMEELKANQAKKTSPVVSASSPDDDSNSTSFKTDLSKSFSSSFVHHKKSVQESHNIEVRASSIDIKTSAASNFDALKKEQVSAGVTSSSIDHSLGNNKSTTKISITENSSSVMTSSQSVSSSSTATSATVKVDEPTPAANIRPTSVNLHNRSISPISRSSINHISKPSPTAATTSTTHILATSNGVTVDVTSRVGELETRVHKLENLVTSQCHTIDELKKMLREESDKVMHLKKELEKYAQCFTQV